MADEDEPRGVIDLAERRAAAATPDPGEPPMGLRREPMTKAVGHCRHAKTRVDEAEHRVWCKACGAELDIWAVVAGIADRFADGWNTADWIRGLRAEKWELEAEVKGLRAERTRLRSELKSLGGRVVERKAAAAPNVVKIGEPHG